MKKTFIVVGTGFVVLMVSLLIIRHVNFNQIGAEKYYTRICEEGKKIEDKAADGTIYTRYEYKQPAYDDDGNKETLTFTANKQLRENAYLLLYVKNEKGVTSYEEVSAEELPEKVD